MGRTFLVFNLNINTIDNVVNPILLSTMCTTVLNSNQMGNNFANWQHNVVIYQNRHATWGPSCIPQSCLHVVMECASPSKCSRCYQHK